MPDTKVSHVIQSKEDFLAELHVGDQFWRMSSHNFRPHTIEGPFKILGFVTLGNEKSLNVRCRIARDRTPVTEDNSVNDLTNEYHGVFTDENEAWIYFREKRKAFDDQAREAKKT